MELFEFILLIIERVFWSDGILYLFWVPTLRIPYKTRIPSMYRFPMTDWYFLRNARANKLPPISLFHINIIDPIWSSVEQIRIKESTNQQE